MEGKIFNLKHSDIETGFRKPVRITITVPYSTHLTLIKRCDEEGRSLSNLAAFLLENSLASI